MMNLLTIKKKESFNNEAIFEIEFVKQVKINIDFILNLINKYSKEDMIKFGKRCKKV